MVHQIPHQLLNLTPTFLEIVHAFPVSENVLNRDFSVETPNAKCSAEITYIWTGEGWIYLAVLLDLFSRRVVGWATGARLDRSLVLSALDQAKQQRRPSAGLACHSDRGSQYASGDYPGQAHLNF